MELCKCTLENYFEKSPGVLSSEEFDRRLGIAYQIVQALNVIHTEYHIIHRDITPNNIFFSQEGAVKLGDFGLATKCKHLVPDSPSPFITVTDNDELIPRLSLTDTQDYDGELEISEPVIEHKGENIFIKEVDEKEEEKLTNGIGTKTFASPEQLNNRDYDQKVNRDKFILLDGYLSPRINIPGLIFSHSNSERKNGTVS